MNLYSREELDGFNKKISDLSKDIAELDKDIKNTEAELKGEGSPDNQANLKKIQLNKKLEKDEKTLEITNLKKKLSASV